MAVALPNDHKVLFYGSADLKRWERLSEFGPAGATGGQWECPTLTEVPVEGGARSEPVGCSRSGLNPGGLQGGSGEQYFVGSFDGARFVNDNPPSTTLWTDYGKDCYCALTFNNLPRTRGARHARLDEQLAIRRQSAHRSLARPDDRSAPPATAQTPQGLRLVQQPVTALERLRGSAIFRGAARMRAN